MNIVRLGEGDERALYEAASSFDGPIVPAAAMRFLCSETHHLLIGYEGSTAAGFISGVEMTHPDKGTEMFLYELGVNEEHRRKGYGSALVKALADLARERGCYGMWVLTDNDNSAALRTYAAAGGQRESDNVMLSWTFETEARTS